MVAVLAPQESSFLGLVSVVAPVIATGNTAVVIASEKAPLPALSLGEVLATSDVPGGVVNVLSGRTAEIAAPLAAHQDVNAIDLAGADEALAKELEIAAADNLKRVLRPQPVDYLETPGIDRMTAFLETKTVWHPTGSLGASGSSYWHPPDSEPRRPPAQGRRGLPGQPSAVRVAPPCRVTRGRQSTLTVPLTKASSVAFPDHTYASPGLRAASFWGG